MKTLWTEVVFGQGCGGWDEYRIGKVEELHFICANKPLAPSIKPHILSGVRRSQALGECQGF